MNADTPETSKPRQNGDLENGDRKRLATPRWIWPFRPIYNFQWILGEVEATRRLITRLVAESGQDETRKTPWLETAKELLNDTEKSAKGRERQRAWISLKAARRACLYGMNKEEILARSIALHNEAEKIDSSWRKMAIQEALNLYGSPLSNTDLTRLFDPELKKDDVELKEIWTKSSRIWRKGPGHRSPGADALSVASQIRDEHFDNIWRKVDRRQNAILTSMFTLAAVTILLVGFWEIWNCLDWFNAAFGKQDISLLIVALFGALGASLSTAYTLVSSDLPNKYTEGAMSLVVTIARPLIGAAAAVAILFIYAGGLLEGVLKPEAFDENIVYALAFTSGFTERLIFSATDKIVKKTKK